MIQHELINDPSEPCVKVFQIFKYVMMRTTFFDSSFEIFINGKTFGLKLDISHIFMKT